MVIFIQLMAEISIQSLFLLNKVSVFLISFETSNTKLTLYLFKILILRNYFYLNYFNV